MNQLLNSRADYYGSPLPRVTIAPSHTAPSQWRSSFLVDCTVEICLLLPIFAHLILNDPLRNARGNRGNRHFLTRPAREFFYHESPSILATATIWFNVSILQFKLLNIQIWLAAAVEISISTPLLSPIQFRILWEKFNFRSDKTFNWNFLNKITNLAVLFNKSFSIDWLIEVYLDIWISGYVHRKYYWCI